MPNGASNESGVNVNSVTHQNNGRPSTSTSTKSLTRDTKRGDSDTKGVRAGTRVQSDPGKFGPCGSFLINSNYSPQAPFWPWDSSSPHTWKVFSFQAPSGILFYLLHSSTSGFAPQSWGPAKLKYRQRIPALYERLPLYEQCDDVFLLWSWGAGRFVQTGWGWDGTRFLTKPPYQQQGSWY